jgi:hypothetical protein
MHLRLKAVAKLIHSIYLARLIFVPLRFLPSGACLTLI